MALSADDAARLAKLQAAYDALISGKQVAQVRLSSGHLTSYAPGDINVLQAEIASLNALAASDCGRTRGALRFRIGR